MAAENDIIIKITGEASLDDAQKQMQELTKRSEELEIEIERLKDKEKQVSASLRSSIKDRKELADVLIQTHRHYSDQRKALQDNIAANKKSIKALSDQVKAYKTLNGMSGKAVQQLRAMREELQRMEDAGEFGSQAFVNLSIAAGKLEDQISDTQQRIRILASDTKEMDALMGLGDGLAGSFYIATSGAELFGGEMEGLQQAFYKVQAAMSILSGAQQVYNALQKDSNVAVVYGNALQKVRDKATQRAAAYERLYNIQKAAGAATNTAQATTTGLWTKAQWKLNAAIAANPVGAILAGLLALGAAIVGVISVYNKFFSTAGKASRELEKIQAENGANAAQRSYERQEQIKATNDAEEDALAKAKKRNASEVELAAIKSKYAKQRADESKKYSADEIERNNKEVEQLKILMDVAQKEADNASNIFGNKKRKLEKLAEAQQAYYDALQKSTDLEHEATEAERASAEADQELADARKQMRLDAQQANIDLMKEGAAKEIAQIEFNYREQMKKYQGQSAEEIAMRKTLQEKMQKEIYEVRHKYQVQAQQLDIDIMRDGQAKEIAQINLNYEEQMRQYAGNSEEEIAMRKALKAKQAQEIADAERKYAVETQKTLTEIDVQAMEERTKVLKGNEGVAGQLKVWNDYYRAREYQIDENARLEIEEINRSTDNEQVKEARIKKVMQQAQADRTALAKEESEKRIEINEQEVTALEIVADKAAHAAERTQGSGRLGALKANLDAQLALYDAQEAQLDAKWAVSTISWQDYEQQKWEITKAAVDARVQYETDAMQAIAEGFETALGYMQQVSDLAFEAINQNIQTEMDALDKEYTTDWEEAQKNADKKYITQKEYEKKKAALEMKQAKYAKAQAIINAGIQTALAIVTTLAQLGATPWGIAASVIAGVMGAAQIAVIASKPLAQYAKGRKGGKGEYALVGEKGPELMYVPSGASIVPNDKIETPSAWSAFGVPELPHANPDTLRYAAEQTAVGVNIDYDRLGASVAAALPKQRNNNVTVNVDRHGVHVFDGGGRHIYLNTKYTGVWRQS